MRCPKCNFTMKWHDDHFKCDRCQYWCKCFMGNCKHLDEYDEDPCEDLEARSGIWGKCREAEVKEK